MEKTFDEQIYDFLRKVPKGKVTTYKALAEKLGSKAYRHVGKVMNVNPYSFNKKGDVPCHRVIGSNGDLVGFASGLKNKTRMLTEEGVEVKNGKVDLKKYRYKFE